MAIRKRGRNWWIDITIGSKRVQQSAKTADRTQAQQLHDKIRADLWREEELGIKQAHTWLDAVKLYLSEKQHLRQLKRVIIPNIEWLSERIAADMPLDKIDSKVIAAIRMDRINRLTVTGHQPKQATINYPLSILQAVLNLARKHGLMNSVPHIEMPNPRNARTRWISRSEADQLIAQCLVRGQTFADLVEFSLETGLRQENAVACRWEWINMAERTLTVPAEEFKNGKSHTIPLSDRAHALLTSNWGRHKVYPFANAHGRPFSEPNEWLKSAAENCKIADFHWHDLRHTWATWHVRAGTPLEILQKLGGWSDYRMVLRYAVFAPDHIAAYRNALQRENPATGSNNVAPIRHAA